MKDLGERIKEYRTSMKMTQADFACRLGVTGASVSAYENGTRLPSYDILIRIAKCDTRSRNKLLLEAALSIWGNPTTACVAGNGGVGSLWDNVGKLRA